MRRRDVLKHLPDSPLYVEARDLLLHDECPLVTGNERSFVVWSPEDELGAIIGAAPLDAIRTAATCSSELIAFSDNVHWVQSALPDWTAEPARIFELPGQPTPGPEHPTALLEKGAIRQLDDLPDDLHEELNAAAEDDTLIAVALSGTGPVAFCYAASQSETLWDVSIGTLASHRREGFAQAAFRALWHHHLPKRPVWGALHSNLASDGLARKLGFAYVADLWVISKPEG